MTAAESPDQESVARRLARHPLPWIALCTLLAVPAHIAGLDFLGFLFVLIAGVLSGAWFVGVTLRMRPARRGAVVHLVVAIALVPALWAAVEVVPDLLPPGGVRAAFGAGLLALPPAAGWVWITLIGRVSSFFRTQAERRAPDPLAWEPDGDGTIVRFRAIPIRMRTLSALIAGSVGVTGAIAVTLLIVFGDVAERIGPRLLILAFGLVFAFPAYLLLTAVLRRGTVDAAVRLEGDRIRIDVDGTTHRLGLDDLDLLRWRTDSDYARIDIAFDDHEISLLVGLAKQPDGAAPQLPALLPRMIRAAERAGLVSERSRQDVLTLRKTA